MRKLLICLLIGVVTSFSLSASASAYKLVSSKSFGRDCLVYTFLNRNTNYLIVKKFNHQNMHEKNDFMTEHYKKLAFIKPFLKLNQMLDGESKNHIFYYEGKKLIIGYDLYDANTSRFTKYESILIENNSCEV